MSSWSFWQWQLALTFVSSCCGFVNLYNNRLAKLCEFLLCSGTCEVHISFRLRAEVLRNCGHAVIFIQHYICRAGHNQHLLMLCLVIGQRTFYGVLKDWLCPSSDAAVFPETFRDFSNVDTKSNERAL